MQIGVIGSLNDEITISVADCIGVDRTVINRHIHHVYKTGELREGATCAKISQVQTEGGCGRFAAPFVQSIPTTVICNPTAANPASSAYPPRESERCATK